MKPIVTVLISTHNHGKFIGRCLRSLISQKLHRHLFNIIVVDDASTDDSDSIIDIFKEDVTYIKNEKCLGLPGSLNVGILKIKTPYFVRVDSDDYVNENFLDYLVNFIEFNKYTDAVATDYYLVDYKETIIERVNCLERPIGCGIIFKTDQIIQLGMYDKEFLLHEDKDLMNRFLKKFTITRLELPLYRYRQHDRNITKNKKLDIKFSKKLSKKIKSVKNK
jgi:glycosyltransferase involved in cell wall biosynthesis